MNSALSDILLHALQATTSPVTVTDALAPDNPIIYCNQAFLDLTGYNEAEVLGKNCRFLQGIDTDKRVVKKLQDSITEGYGIDVTLLNYRKDGEQFWNDLQITPLKNSDGVVTHFFGFQNNISERLERDRAATLVEKLEAELQLSEMESQQRAKIEQLKTRFANIINNDLRAPLTVALENIDNSPLVGDKNLTDARGAITETIKALDAFTESANSDIQK